MKPEAVEIVATRVRSLDLAERYGVNKRSQRVSQQGGGYHLWLPLGKMALGNDPFWTATAEEPWLNDSERPAVAAASAAREEGS